MTTLEKGKINLSEKTKADSEIRNGFFYFEKSLN